ncbi:MAG: hypothetical protein IK077_14030 [Thermoguttaceae bacterium]|nr:hypothetical protein [Thermoguttaceae bacterium]
MSESTGLTQKTEEKQPSAHHKPEDKFYQMLHELSYSKDKPIFPYVVAVTGHRDCFNNDDSVPACQSYAKDQIKGVFREQLMGLVDVWEKACGFPTPFILLTGMADGADQLAAEVALESDFKKRGVRVLAVLPMKEAAFRETVDDKDNYDNLLSEIKNQGDGENDKYVIEFPLVKKDGDGEYVYDDAPNPEEILKDSQRRDWQYCRHADFLAMHSHIMFAFWDGRETQFEGGTYAAVRFKITGVQHKKLGGKTAVDFLTYPSIGPVAQILTPRSNSINQECFKTLFQLNDVENRPPVFLWTRDKLIDENGLPYCPDQSQMTEERRCKELVADEKTVKETVYKLGTLNSYVHKNYQGCKKEDIDKEFKQSASETFEDDADIKNKLDEEGKTILDHYAVADQLAKKYRTYVDKNIETYAKRIALFITLGGLLAFFEPNAWIKPMDDASFSNCVKLVFSGNHSFFSFPFVYNLAYLLGSLLYVIVVARLVYLWMQSKKNEYHLALHRCRSMAEALRIQLFWRMVGIGDCASRFYHSHQSLKTDWLRAGLNGLDVLLPSPSNTNAKPYQYDDVKKYWCKAQVNYFKKTSGKRKEEANKIRKKHARRWVLTLTAIVVFVQPFCEWITTSLKNIIAISPFQWTSYLIFICTTLLLVFLYKQIAALTKGELTIQLKRLEAEAERYDRAKYPFMRALLLLQNAKDDSEKQAIFKQLGAEALTENADWYLAAGERELALPR